MKNYTFLLLALVLLISGYSLAITQKTHHMPLALVRLQHEKEFKHTVALGGQCSDSAVPCQKGVQQYEATLHHEGERVDTLTINSQSLVEKFGSAQHKEAFKEFETFLHTPFASLKPGLSLAHLLTLFNEGDNGVMYDTHLIAPLNISYPGAHQVRAVYALEGEDSPDHLIVRIFAQKAEVILMATGKVSDIDFNAHAEQRFNRCNPSEGGPEQWKQADQCYYREIKQDPQLQRAILQKAKSLTSQFALVR